MASKISNEDDTIAEINIVPFVDIILVVLIIFMVTTPYIIQNQIKVKLPKAQSGTQSKENVQLKVSLLANGTLYFNDQSISIDELSLKVKSIYKINPEAQAIISADKEVSHGEVVKIVDLIKQNGIEKFAISVLSQ